ncbi:methyltransferase [Mangrovibrevibacter kandeliae]|uniref:methyltransferase n=1 Tax=Mangrovibrevibacter kandeliae TaxID=2968473 RepID=UPI002119484A|nr:methyltransferase [Aurantimonas sp. CSK15Z-1]MCQ8783792.1 methyltransferase [Aurantimonas sp. CSK15Z-1]
MSSPETPDVAPPRPAAAVEAAEPGPGSATSVDAFYGGAFHVVQPRGHGQRAGLDALLLAAMLPGEGSGRVADLGAGTGAAGLGLAIRVPAAQVTLVERNRQMLELLRATLGLPQNVGLRSRLAVMEADLLARRPVREAAGLADGSFSAVITNPPFHPPGGRVSPDRLRAEARAVPDAGFLGDWLRTAAALLASGGRLAMIARPDNLAELVAAADRRIGGLTLVPVHARPERPAIRILLGGRKGSRAPLRIHTGLVLHEADGAPSALGTAVSSGRADLGVLFD